MVADGQYANGEEEYSRRRGEWNNLCVYATVEEFEFPADAEASLTIRKAVLLTWKQSIMDYIVESASSPEGPWTEVEEFQSQIIDDETHMTMLVAGASRIFRLASPPLD